MKKKNPSNANGTYSKQQARERKRLREFLKSAKERGYTFYDTKVSKDGALPTSANEFELPKSVKNPTKVTINRLKRITVDYLYERAIYVDPETGEVHTGVEGRKIERSKAAQKGAETRARNKQKEEHPISIAPIENPLNLAILDRISRMLSSVDFGDCKKPGLVEYKENKVRSLSELFESVIADHENDPKKDIYEYAHYLEGKAEEINNYFDTAMKSSDEKIVEINLGAIATIINRGPLTKEVADLISWASEGYDIYQEE